MREPQVVAISPDVEDNEEIRTSGLSDAGARKMFAELKVLRVESERIAKAIEEMTDRVLEPLTTRILAIESRLRTSALLEKRTISTADGQCIFRSEYWRESYPKERVETFADEHPDIAEEIRALKSRSFVGASTSIKIKT